MSPGPTPLSVTVIEYSEMAPACLSPIRCFARKVFTWSIDQSDWTPEQAPNLTLRLSLNRAFSHDVTAAILVFQNNETAAMLGVLNKPCGSWTLSQSFVCWLRFISSCKFFRITFKRIIWSWEKLLKIRRHFPFGNHFQVNSRNLLFYYYVFILLGEKWCWSLWNWRPQNCLIPPGINV